VAIAKANKPEKPTPDFPLFPHASGQWAKKIGGKVKYFGHWDKPDAAMARYLGTTPATPVASTPAKIARDGKPKKPSASFPLFAHDGGQWAKKIGGKVHYFGAWASDRKGKAALARFLEERDDLLIGHKPLRHDRLTVADLVNHFLTAKTRKVESDELAMRTWKGYHAVCRRIVAILGPNRQVSTLRASDFERLRASFARTDGPVRLANEIVYVRMVFKYGYDCDLIDRPVKFGPEFKRPSRLVLRRQRQQREPKLFSADEIRKLLRVAGPQLRAMIFLGINAALGNNDCAFLTMRAIRDGWLDFPRPKTAMPRRCPLWPETLSAINVALDTRPTPKDEGHEDRVFITKYGFTWEPKSTCDSPVSKETAKHLKALGIHRRGVGFYALRHTFQTVAEKTRDKDAVRAIMGHAETANDMSAVYSEEPVSDDRLLAVVNHVRQWLLKSSE
jgi:integrase